MRLSIGHGNSMPSTEVNVGKYQECLCRLSSSASRGGCWEMGISFTECSQVTWLLNWNPGFPFRTWSFSLTNPEGKAWVWGYLALSKRSACLWEQCQRNGYVSTSIQSVHWKWKEEAHENLVFSLLSTCSMKLGLYASELWEFWYTEQECGISST